MAKRVFVCGGPGSGKSTLAQTLSQRTGLPVHALDEIAREGGGRGPEKTADERAAAVAAILTEPRWIAEGVQLGWTRPLIEAADVVIWLDHVPWHRSSGRIVRRFLSQAIAEARSRRGRERFLRLRDYGRRLRELIVSVPETRSYARDELSEELLPFEAKVVHCRTADDVSMALESVASAPE